MTSTIELDSSCGLRSSSAFSGTAARSSARTDLSDPLTARPMGVRTASTITASGIRKLSPWSFVPQLLWLPTLPAGAHLMAHGRSGVRGPSETRTQGAKCAPHTSDRGQSPAERPRTRSQVEPRDAELVEPNVMRELVAHGAHDLIAQ